MMRHIWHRPDDIVFLPCVHLPTQQRYSIMAEDFAVETKHGTMSGRAGDVLMEGVNGCLYVLTLDSLKQSYLL